MQITPNILMNNLLQTVQTQEQRLNQLQSEASTGLKFSIPSQDPTGAQQTISLNGALSEVTQYTSTSKDAQGWLNEANGALTQAETIWNTVLSTAQQAGNSTLNAADRQDLAETMKQSLKSLVQIFNTQYNGQYIFGGYQDTTAPATTPGTQSIPPTASAVASAWPSSTAGQSKNFQIDTQSTVSVNLTGYEDVGQPKNASGNPENYFGALLTDLQGLTQAITQGPSAVQKMLPNIQNDLGYVTTAQGIVGGRLDRINNTLNQLQSVNSDLTQSVSNTSGANMTKVTAQLAQEEQAYQAALQSGAQVLPLSLLNFIKT